MNNFNLAKVLAVVALVLAILSLFVSGPLLVAAVILLAITHLL